MYISLLYNTVSPAWLCDYLEWDGRGGGSSGGREYAHTKLGLTRTVVWQKPTQHCKAIILHIHTYVYILHIFIHSSVDGHLGCLTSWLLQIVLQRTLAYLYLFEL